MVSRFTTSISVANNKHRQDILHKIFISFWIPFHIVKNFVSVSMFNCENRMEDVSAAVNLDDVLKLYVGGNGRSVRLHKL